MLQAAQQPARLAKVVITRYLRGQWTYSWLSVALEAWKALYTWLRRVFVVPCRPNTPNLCGNCLRASMLQSHNRLSDENGFGLKREWLELLNGILGRTETNVSRHVSENAKPMLIS